MKEIIYDLFVNQERLSVASLNVAISKTWIDEADKAKMIADLEAKKAGQTTTTTEPTPAPTQS